MISDINNHVARRNWRSSRRFCRDEPIPIAIGIKALPDS